MNLKEMFSYGWFFRVLLVLWCVSAVFVVYLLGRVDWIVHHELYNFGLQFSLEWAAGYWDVLRIIYAFLAAPIFLTAAYFGLDVWRFLKGRRNRMMKTEAPRQAKPMMVRSKEAVAEQNHMLISCPKCKRVFSKPLVMLDFSGRKTRLVNVCPYCNSVLGCAEEGDAEKKENDSMGLVDLKERRVEHK